MTLLGTDRKKTRQVLRHLIYVNIFIICLDCSLMGLCYSGFFFLQGFYKAAIYAVKLRTEFTILNQLRSSLPGASTNSSGYRDTYARSGPRAATRAPAAGRVQGSQDSDVEMVVMQDQPEHGDIRVQKEIVITSSKEHKLENVASTSR